MSRTWFTIRNAADAPAAEISIHDEIGAWGVSAKDFLSQLKGIPASRPLTLSLHSPGGEVFDGLAIYHALKARGNVNVRIEGLAASMASVIAMAGQHIEMPRNAYLMIHNPSGFAMGDSSDMRQLADLLDKLKGSLIAAYRDRTQKSDEDLIAMMDAETWLTGEEAVAHGFADAVTDVVALSASAFKGTRLTASLAHPPAALFDSRASDMADNITPAAEIEPVDPPAPESPAVEPPAPAAEPETPAAPVEPTAPEAKGFFDRILATLSGDAAIKAELVTVRAALATREGEVATLTTQLTAATAKAAQFDALVAKVTQLEAEAKTTGQAAAEIAASHGLKPEQLAALPPPGEAVGSLLDQFEAITDPAARQAFYNKHKSALTTAAKAA